MYEFINQGGFVMYVILGLSILTVTMIFERAWSLRRSVVVPTMDVAEIEALVRSGDVDAAIRECEKKNTAMHRILWSSLKNRGVKRTVMKEILEEVGRQEVAHLDRYIGVLGVIAAISPLLGLLGTVMGMIEVFQVIALEGVGKADVLAGGISKALNTTAAGLTVAIPALVAYRMFEAKVNYFVIEIEEHALRFIDLLKGDRE